MILLTQLLTQGSPWTDAEIEAQRQAYFQQKNQKQGIALSPVKINPWLKQTYLI